MFEVVLCHSNVEIRLIQLQARHKTFSLHKYQLDFTDCPIVKGKYQFQQLIRSANINAETVCKICTTGHRHMPQSDGCVICLAVQVIYSAHEESLLTLWISCDVAEADI